MKRLTKLLLLVSALMCMSVLPVSAADGDSTYDKLSSTSFFKKYCTIEQPDDALPLDAMSIALTKEAQTDNYSGGYYNLPRLRSGYSYSLYDGKDKDKFSLPNTVYPTLRLEQDIVVNDTVKLGVFENGSDTPLQSWSLLGPAEGLKAATDTEDCSADFSSSLYPKLGDVKQLNYYDTETTVYNHALHKYGFVTRNHMVLAGLPNDIKLNSELKLAGGKLKPVESSGMFDENAYKGSLPIYVQNYPYRVTDLDYRNQAPWNFNEILSHDLTAETDGFSLYYSDYANVEDGSYASGIFTEKGSSAGAELIAVTDKALYAYSTDGASDVSKDAQHGVTGDPEKVSVTYNVQFDLRFNGDGRIHFLNPYAVLPGDIKPNGYKLTPDAGWETPIAVSSSLPGDAYHPSVTLLEYDNAGETFTVNFESNEGSAVKSEVYKVNDLPPVSQLPIPNRDYYTFSGWYTDSALTVPYDPAAYTAEAGGTVTFYAKWEYSGGTYHVVFYDRKRDKSYSDDFNGDVQPTFPVIDPYQGYSFKCWELLGSANSTSGTVYDPTTFKPVPGNTYYFNAVFATSGIIKSVTNTKDTYYLNDSVDKGHLSVVVQTDDAGATRTLASSEFSVSPSTLSKVGSNTVTVTFTETGAMASITLTAVEDTVSSISATYKGDSLTVGSNINKDDIEVTRRYKSGKSDKTTDFTISPSTVQSVGTNSIRVSSSGFTTSVTVTGLRVPANTGNTGQTGGKKAVKRLSAVYTGNQLYVGDTLKSSDISVTATYEDGSTGTLSNSMYSYTPSYIRRAGTNTITVVYSGITTTFTVEALENSSVSPSQGGSDDRGSTSASSKPGTSHTLGSQSGDSADSGTSVSGGPNDKTTSKGYLGGSNILSNGINMNTSSDATFVNEVDIMSAIETASKEAEYINIELINLAEGNDITPEMFQALADRDLTMRITMLDNDTKDKIALWVIEGGGFEDETEFVVFDPNIVMFQIDKSAENMIAVNLQNDTDVYALISSVELTLEDIFSPGSTVTLYATDSSGAASKRLSDVVWGAGASVRLPLPSAPHYILTDSAMPYADGSDLIHTDLIQETETGTEMETSDSADDTDDDINVVQPEKTEKKFPIIPVVCAVIFVLLVIAAVFVYFYTLHKRNQSLVEDEEEDDDIPEEEAPVVMQYDYSDEDDDDIF